LGRIRAVIVGIRFFYMHLKTSYQDTFKNIRIKPWYDCIKAWNGRFMAWYDCFKAQNSALYHVPCISITILMRRSLVFFLLVIDLPCAYVFIWIWQYAIVLMNVKNCCVRAQSVVLYQLFR